MRPTTGEKRDKRYSQEPLRVLTEGGRHAFLALVFVFALVLLQDRVTLPLGVYNLRGEYGSNVPQMAAALTVAVVPPLIVYAVAQRHLIRGITAGAVKG